VWDSDFKRLLEFVCLMTLATANLGLLLLETVGHVFGINFAPSVGPHNLVSFPFVIGLSVLLMAECIEGGTKRARPPQAIVALASGVVALAYAVTSIGDPIVDSMLPFSAALLSCALLTAAIFASRGRKAFTLPGAARLMTMVGISVLLVGVLVSSAMRISSDGTVGVGQTVSVGGESFTVSSIDTASIGNTIYMPGYGVVKESIDTSVSYVLSGPTAGSYVAVLRYFPGRDVYVPIPSIQSTVGGDLYLAVTQTQSVIRATSSVFFNGTSSDPSQVTLTAQFIPDVSLIWIGAVIMLLANLPYVLLGSRQGEREQPGNESGAATLGSNRVMAGQKSETGELRESSLGSLQIRSGISNNENRVADIYRALKSRFQVNLR
jgi:cytochrome c biogenesis factor